MQVDNYIDEEKFTEKKDEESLEEIFQEINRNQYSAK